MTGGEYHLSGRTQGAMVEDARGKGIRGRLVVFQWPPLRDTEAWARLRALRANEPTIFAARLFPDGQQTTKAYDEYLERYFRFVDDAAAFDEAQTIHGLSSTTRTCKRCGSHVAVEHVEGEACPVCGDDLRSNTVQKTLARWRERIAKVREQGEAEATKAGWLGSWAAVSVEGTTADDPAERHRDILRRRYDSEVVSLDARGDEGALYLPRPIMERLASHARATGMTLSGYLEHLLDEAGA